MDSGEDLNDSDQALPRVDDPEETIYWNVGIF
jgi:hypothetical protein